MKTLPTEFKKYGDRFVQLSRKDNVALYARIYNGTTYAYEVVIIRQKPARTILNKVIPAQEVYPSNEEFGILGWCFTSKPKALEKYHELL